MADLAILAPCASRKRIAPEAEASADKLQKAPQNELETAWSDVVSSLPLRTAARDLYAGRGFGLARASATAAGADLYVISAGLGLVRADSLIPSYGITVSDRGDHSVARRVTGRFDPSAWWSAVSRTAYSDRIEEVAERHDGLILVALTVPYAAMLGDCLASLPKAALGRLRLFGRSIGGRVPQVLAPAIMPYDSRLDAITPGTRADFSQRALRHFCGSATLDGSRDAEGNAGEVRSALARHEAPRFQVRPRRSDEEIIALISSHLDHTKGIGRILRLIRSADGLACEQARFSRLYGRAVEQRSMV